MTLMKKDGRRISTRLRVLLIAVILLSIVRSLSAQDEQMNAIADKIAEAIHLSRLNSVIVLDFSAGNEKFQQLGTKFADDFNIALMAPKWRLEVANRAGLARLIADNHLEPKNIYDPHIAQWLAQDMGTQTFILGSIIQIDESIKLTVSAYRQATNAGIAAFSVVVPLSDAIRSQIPVVSDENPISAIVSAKEQCTPGNKVPCAGLDGISMPTCLRCPAPAFSTEAEGYVLEGTVVLVAIVNENGEAQDVRVVTALPYGLTKQAVEGVEKWKFKPAIDSGGKSVAVRQVIEVTFHSYH